MRKPQYGESYWFANLSYNLAMYGTWMNDNYDIYRYEFGLIGQTEQETEQILEEINKLLKSRMNACEVL